MLLHELNTKVPLSVKIQTGLNYAVQTWQLTLKNYSVFNQSKRICFLAVMQDKGSILIGKIYSHDEIWSLCSD